MQKRFELESSPNVLVYPSYSDDFIYVLIKVNNYRSHYPEYSFTLKVEETNMPPNNLIEYAEALSLGTSKKGYFETDKQSKFYMMPAKFGKRYRISANGAALKSLDLSIYLKSDYTLLVEEIGDVPNWNRTFATVLSPDIPKYDSFDSYDYERKWYKIPLESGKAYKFIVTGTSLGWLWLSSQYGLSMLEFVDEFPYQFKYFNSSSDDYHHLIIQRNSSSIDFKVLFYEIECETENNDTTTNAVPLAINSEIFGSFGSETDVDFYSVELTAGITYYIYSSGPYIYGYLYDSPEAISEVAFSQGYVTDSNLTITYTPEKRVNYYIQNITKHTDSNEIYY